MAGDVGKLHTCSSGSYQVVFHLAVLGLRRAAAASLPEKRSRHRGFLTKEQHAPPPKKMIYPNLLAFKPEGWDDSIFSGGFVTQAVAKEKDTTGFGERLKALRVAAKMTQQELADRVGIAAQNVTRFERGGRTPSWDTVIKFAKALGVDANAFLPEDE